MDLEKTRGGLHNNFGALRLLLSTLVIFGHFKTLPGLFYEASGLYGYADFAVDAFFVVSGYLIASSWAAAPRLGGFYIRRLFRLYPLYAVVILLQAGAMMLVLGDFAAHMAGLGKYLVTNLAFANFLSYDIDHVLAPLNNPGINPSLWTLKVEIGFYLILPALWALTRRFSGWFLVAVFALSTLYTYIALDHGKIELARQLPGQLRFFVIGIAMFRYQSRIMIPVLPAIMIALGTFILCSLRHEIPMMAVYPLLVGAWVFVLALRIPSYPLRFDISYGVYLFHGPLIQLSLLFGWYENNLRFVLLIVVMAYALAILAEALVEQPGIALGKKLARRFSPPRAGRAV